jgi:hypothetical protein
MMVFAVEVGLYEFLARQGRVPTPRSARCPVCRHPRVIFDGWWTRQTRQGPVDIHRVLCSGCGRSHSCWPDVLVGRRVDLAVVIGAALEAKAAGVGHRRIGARLGVPAATVRGWLRRFATLAGELTRRLLVVAADADPTVRAPPPGPPLAVAVAAVGLTGAAMASLSGEPVDRWRFAVVVTAGGLLGAPTDLAPAAGG